MSTPLSITSAITDPALLDLPWAVPLEQWPDEQIAALPKGISRHLVRFARLGDRVVAIKETNAEIAKREFELLRTLQRLDIPCVEPLAVIEGRVAADGEPLDAALVTRHLKFSLPYRALYSQTLHHGTAKRLVDALALLLVQLHLVGFYWGDVSLSNTLFRRDAGALAAYLVDAETGTLIPQGLSDGRREGDLEIARVNIAGELMDIAAGGRLDPHTEPTRMAQSLVDTYRDLWQQLTATESIGADERWRIHQRVERLNELGFDIEELAINAEGDGNRVRIAPKVVEAGHHHRRLLGLTGIDVGENQARRLLNDLDAFAAQRRANAPHADDEQLAHEWVVQQFEPVVTVIPQELRGKLEPAEVFHEVLEHRWYLSERVQRHVPLAEATLDYIEDQLRHRRDEASMLGAPTTEALSLQEVADALDAQSGETDEVDWRDLV